MSAEGQPPVPLPGPVYSPDGLWMWDGSRWVPRPGPDALATSPRQRRRRPGKGAAGCLAFPVALVVGLLFHDYLADVLSAGSRGQVDKSTPVTLRYPRATIVDAGGDYRSGHLRMRTADDVGHVISFYEHADVPSPEGGTIPFHRSWCWPETCVVASALESGLDLRPGAEQFAFDPAWSVIAGGRVRALARGGQTEIRVEWRRPS